MRKISYSAQFKRDVKQLQKRGKDMNKLKEIMQLLIENKPLPNSLKDHALKGSWKPRRDLHIEPDWLLIYIADDKSVHFDRLAHILIYFSLFCIFLLFLNIFFKSF